MYFWNIGKLKADLIRSPLTDKEIFPYFLAHNVLLTLTMIPVPPYNSLDYINSFLLVFAVLLGTYYLYQCNDGRNGKHFLQRYFSLGWVVSVRFLVMVLVPTLILYFVMMAIFSSISEETTVSDVIITLILEVLYYLLLGNQIKEVASATSGNAS